MRRHDATGILPASIVGVILVVFFAAFDVVPHNASRAQPGPTITATLTITSTLTADTPTPTVAATPSPAWVYLHVDDALRVQICDGLAPVIGTVPPPLIGCSDVGPWHEAPPIATPGQLYILWPGDWRYRIYIDATPTPWPGWCEPRIVTATPAPTDTPTPTITPDAIGTAVAGTLTALAPTTTGTPRPTDTRAPTPPPEATPTPAVWRLLVFPVFRRVPMMGRGR